MSQFIDEYMPDSVPGYPVIASPRWSTEIVIADSGDEQVNQRWSHPLHKYNLPEAVRSMDVFNGIRDHWLIMRGPAHTWPFRDPLDHASVPLLQPARTPDTSAQDQVLCIGDGYTRSFQIRKTYTRGSQSYLRTITLPVVNTLRIWREGQGASAAGEMTTGWSVNRTTGIVTFDEAPALGRLHKWGGLFDVPVRFESDDAFDGIAQAFGVGGFADITLLETRSC